MRPSKDAFQDRLCPDLERPSRAPQVQGRRVQDEGNGGYALGKPEDNSDVFVSANYRMSFDILRSSLSGMDAWILVLDTNGINVWCAAGKGTFGTEELVKRIFTEKLHECVSHRRLILPQLGAPGVSAPDGRKQTGFRPIYGPVRATDIKAFVAGGYRPRPGMRPGGVGRGDRVP